jgi:tetratricopeptide (TPR) repeat protein
MSLAAALLAVSISAAQSQPAQDEPRIYSLYEVTLARYVEGDFDRAVDEAASQHADDLDAPFREAWRKAYLEVAAASWRRKTATPVVWHQAQDRLARLMIAAMLLHTEAAFRAPGDEVEKHLDLARIAAQSLEDIKVEHHSAGSGLIDPADVARVVHDWHVLAASVLIARGTGRDVFEFIDKALVRYPKDPELELAFGVFHEREATESIVDVSLARDIYLASVVTSWRHALMTAADYYDRSLKDGSDSEEARLRLGHVHALLGEERKAQAALATLAESAATPSIRYLALLFLAGLAENHGQRDAAQSRYLQALVLAPDAQAPLLGLSRLQDEAGDEAGARSWLERSFKAVGSQRVDPWWIYGKSPLWLFGERVTRLRQYLRP